MRKKNRKENVVSDKCWPLFYNSIVTSPFIIYFWSSIFTSVKIQCEVCKGYEYHRLVTGYESSFYAVPATAFPLRLLTSDIIRDDTTLI